LIIRFTSVKLWGEFVQILIFVNLANHILYWGNREYLLKVFSKTPAKIQNNWQSSLVSRIPLLVLFVILTLLINFSVNVKVYILVWGFSLFIYRSFEVLIIYYKRFFFLLMIEIFGAGIFVICFLFINSNLDLESLILIFAFQVLLKSIWISIYFKKDLLSKYVAKLNYNILLKAFPFFLVSISGMLHTRIDLYCVAYFLNEIEVGTYQVYINLFIYIQAFSAFILTPFLKDLYRLPSKIIEKISRTLFVIGLIIVVPALFFVHFILNIIYHLHVSLPYFIFGAIYILPAFYYAPKVYSLFNNNYQIKVVMVTCYGIFLNLILNIFLINQIGMLGAIISSATVQLLVLVAFTILERTTFTKITNRKGKIPVTI